MNKLKAGFTLVELLIVVAIIGVLSTIGVPTFRRMIQKSKKAEAVTNLGGLYKTEAGFFAEWQFYGANLIAMGFDIDGLTNSVHPGRYSIGFPLGLCGVSPPALPPQASEQGKRLLAKQPSYYTTGTLQHYVSSQVNGSMTAYCRSASLGTNAESFIATASGVISPSVDVTTGDSKLVDQWIINSDRELSNVVDGIR